LTDTALSSILYIYNINSYYRAGSGGDFLKIIISNNAGIPIYEQIKKQVIDAIHMGEIKENDPLPSMRQLAKDLKISLITTMRAYNDLEAEGYVVSVQGKGCYVKAQDRELIREKMLYTIEQHLGEAITTAKLAGIDKDELAGIMQLLYDNDK